MLILAALGTVAAPSVVRDSLEDLPRLRQVVPSQGIVGYRGCDTCYHYFCVPSGDVYTVPRRAWAVTALPVTLGLCLPLVFQGDRLVVPPEEWSAETDLWSMQWAVEA